MYKNNLQEQHLNTPIEMIFNSDPNININKNLHNIKKIVKLFKQVRTNIGLADTLIPSSCDSSKIIYGNHVYS